MSVITSSDIKIISNFSYDKILNMTIKQVMNEHSTAHFECIIKYSQKEKIIERFSEDTIIRIEDSNNILFAGYITDAKVKRVGDEYFTLCVDLISTSILLDKVKKSRSFQDTSETIGSIANLMVSEMGGSLSNNLAKDRAIQNILLQYNETNWEFTKRLASLNNESIYPIINTSYPYISLGLPNGSSKKIKLNSSSYKKGFSKRFYKIYSDTDISYRKNYIYYKVTSRNNYSIGSLVEFKGNDYYICEKEANLIRDELIFTYTLGKKELLTVPTSYNENIIGLTLKGSVLNVQGEKIKVKLEIDKNQSTQTAYEFHYTPTSGNLMYSMPEKGETVLLYFSSKEESSAQIISTLRTNESKCTDSSEKKLITPKNKALVFNNNSLYLKLDMNDDGCSYIKLLDDSGILFNSKQKINISALKKLILKGLNINLSSPIKIAMFQGNDGSTYVDFQGDVNVSSENSHSDIEGELKLVYPRIIDAPEEVEFDYGSWIGNILWGLAAVAAVAVVAGIITLATGGTGALVAGALIGGTMAVIGKARSDLKSGNVSSAGRYIAVGGVGAIVGAITSGGGAYLSKLGYGSAKLIARRIGFEVAASGLGYAANTIASGDDMSLGGAGLSVAVSLATFGIFEGKNIYNSAWRNYGQNVANNASRNLATSVTVEEADNICATAANRYSQSVAEQTAKTNAYNAAQEAFDRTYAEVIDATAEANVHEGAEQYAQRVAQAEAAHEAAKEAQRRAARELASANTNVNAASNALDDAIRQADLARQVDYGEHLASYYSHHLPSQQELDDAFNASIKDSLIDGGKQQAVSSAIEYGLDNTGLFGSEGVNLTNAPKDIKGNKNTVPKSSSDNIEGDKKKEIEKYRKEIEERQDGQQEMYVSRGALLFCKYGTHSRRLDLEEDHGYRVSYSPDGTYMQPFINYKDTKYGENHGNVKFFGVCQCPDPPEGNEVILVKDKRLKDDGSGEENVKGPKCRALLDSVWLDAKEDKVLGGNGEYAVTTRSFLFCKRGGIIEIYSSGQEYTGDEDDGKKK